MSITPPSAATAAAAPSEARAETKAERVERQARMLRELAAITMSIARAEEQIVLARAAQAMNAAEAGRPAPPQPRGGEAGAPIARISRAVRLTLAMEGRLYDELEAEQTASTAPARKPEPSAQEQRRTEIGIRGGVLSATIVPVVEQAIEAAEDPQGDGSDTERRLDHLGERLADEDEIISFGTLPIGASVARLCAMLGLTPDWSLWENEDWAIEEAQTDAPGSPYASGGPESGGAAAPADGEVGPDDAQGAALRAWAHEPSDRRSG